MRCPLCFFALCMLILSFNSCKKGCTNARAFNYEPSAKEDDASCMFCDSSVLFTREQQGYEDDDMWGSPHYQQYVLVGNMSATVYHYTGNACKQMGMVNTCNNSDPFSGWAYVDFTLSNLTTDTMIVNTSVRLSDNTGNIKFDTVLTGLTIGPNSTVIPRLNIPFGCAHPNTFFSQAFFFSSSFQYR
jgi:hypothetical protein